VAVRIETVAEPSDEVLVALNALLPQLNPAIVPPDRHRLARLVADPAVTLLVAKDGDAIVGTATVIAYTSPAWTKARIEDVVVDQSARGQGVGRALVDACIEVARARSCTIVELQSKRSRVEANRLYQEMGFELRDSNFYRMTLR